jgi:hypothetical protein
LLEPRKLVLNTLELATWSLTALTGVLAVSTIVYTWVAYKLYKSSNKQSEVLEKQLKVTIAQLKINALQASIKAEEIESAKKSPSARDEYIAKIRGIGNEMQRMINELE